VSKTPKARDITEESQAYALDELALFRARFYQLPGAIYLDGS
jgi:hypothetical protein